LDQFRNCARNPHPVTSIGLLTLSGWLLAGTALAGSAGLYSFNYLLPAAGIRAAAMIRTVGRYAERVVNHDATFRVLTDLRVFTFKKILQLSPASTNRFQQSDLLNRPVADVDTLDHLYLRVRSLYRRISSDIGRHLRINLAGCHIGVHIRHYSAGIITAIAYGFLSGR